MCIVQNVFMNSIIKYEVYFMNMETTDLRQVKSTALQNMKSENHSSLFPTSNVARNPIVQEVMKSLTDKV